MSKTKRILLRVLPVVLVGLLVVSNVFGISLSDLPEGDGSTVLSGVVGNVWATVATVLQVLAVAAVVFAGIRYMFASANDKADIKKQLIILVLGAVLVFGASAILKIVMDVTNEVIKE